MVTVIEGLLPGLPSRGRIDRAASNGVIVRALLSGAVRFGELTESIPS